LAQTPGWHAIPVSDVLHKLSEQGRLTLEVREALSKAQSADGSLTILPGTLGAEVQTDGFFIAILQKGN